MTIVDLIRTWGEDPISDREIHRYAGDLSLPYSVIESLVWWFAFEHVNISTDVDVTVADIAGLALGALRDQEGTPDMQQLRLWLYVGYSTLILHRRAAFFEVARVLKSESGSGTSPERRCQAIEEMDERVVRASRLCWPRLVDSAMEDTQYVLGHVPYCSEETCGRLHVVGLAEARPCLQLASS